MRRVRQQFSRLNPSVYSAALCGGCCTVLIARFDVNRDKQRLFIIIYTFSRFHDNWGLWPWVPEGPGLDGEWQLSWKVDPTVRCRCVCRVMEEDVNRYLEGAGRLNVPSSGTWSARSRSASPAASAANSYLLPVSSNQSVKLRAAES